jgi:hypothetical protein
MLNDADDIDVRLKVMSTTRKWLKYFEKPNSHDWLFFIDDDTWVNANNVKLLLSRLPATPCVVYYRIGMVTSKDANLWKAFGKGTNVDARAEALRKGPRFNGGAGLLMNAAAFSQVQEVISTHEHYVQAYDVLHNDVNLSFDAQHMWPYTIAQDQVLCNALSVIQCETRMISSQKIDKPSDKPWCHDTGIQKQRNWIHSKKLKCVADFNVFYPITQDGHIDYERCAAFSHVTEHQAKVLHVLNDRATLCTWHHFEKPSDFYEMQHSVLKLHSN